MSKLIPFIIFFICLMIITKRLNRYHFSSVIAVRVWMLVETLCIGKPSRELVFLIGVIAILLPTLITKNIVGKIFKYLLSMSFILISLIFALAFDYYINFGKLGYDEFQALMQTDINEAVSNAFHFTSPLSILWWILFSIVIFSPFFVPSKVIDYISNLFSGIKYFKKLKYILLFLVLIPLKYVYDKYDDYSLDYKPYIMYKTVAANMDISGQRVKPILPVSISNKDVDVIFILGESVVADRMSAYGYYRETTPWLKDQLLNQNVILFNKAFSLHSYTNATVPYILSSASFNNPSDISTAPSIINFFESKGFETWWISNQEKTALFTNNFTLLAQEANNLYFSTEDQFHDVKDDSILLNQIAKAIRNKGKRKFIGIHIMGSHAVYADRYPSTFNPDLGYYGPELWGNIGNDMIEASNCYDTSIAYTDKLISDVIKLIPNDKKTIVLYLSDHGEGVLTGQLHNSSKIMHHDMFHIPLFIWANQSFKDSYPDVLSKISEIKDDYITNDKAYDLLSFIIEDDKNLKNLVSSSRDTTYTRYGEKSLNDLNWFNVSQKINRIKSITNRDIVLQGVNTLEKVRYAKNCDFDGIQIDMIFNNQKKVLQPDGVNDLSPIHLENYLRLLSNYNYKKLILSIKNIDEHNGHDIFNYLSKLDTTYNFKERTVIELNFLNNNHSQFKLDAFNNYMGGGG